MKKLIFSALAGVLMGAGFQSHAGEMEDNQRATGKKPAKQRALGKMPAKRHIFEMQLRAYQAAESARAKQEARDSAAKKKAQRVKQAEMSRGKVHLPMTTHSPKLLPSPLVSSDSFLPDSSSKGISGSGGWVQLSELKSVKCLLPAAPAALNKNPPKGKGSTGRR